MDGGIYVDIQSYQAVWHSGNSLHPPPDQSLPLEVILQKPLDAWATGEFYWDSRETTIKARSWTQHDVEQSVAAFYHLLSSIELRIPRKENKAASYRRLEPLDYHALAPFQVGAFAASFLTTAHRPDFSFVAPAIRVFTPPLLDTPPRRNLWYQGVRLGTEDALTGGRRRLADPDPTWYRPRRPPTSAGCRPRH
ncbi:hypothetical protein E0Z10_g8680 [Xylaria hypoxylon]|uniref:Uncharacterized protein n=1 Tax=Xylaria hypoxylon TaxID=37992 RepID=A0A4Z0YUF8_9PEZI|nr:hypothetical protein E0Z10_g8680 [Xylaria hypoxylon]